MTNRERITSNNALIDEAIEKANALPDAGDGGGSTVEPVIEPFEVTENGTYTATNGVDGYSPITVNVPVPDGYIQPSGTLNITENGQYDVTDKASINVQIESGEGGGTVTGVCESLTVNALGADIGTMYYSQSGDYIIEYGSGSEHTIYDIDVNSTVFVSVSLPTYGHVYVETVSGVEVLIEDPEGFIMFKCTSAEPASITIGFYE